jgi:Leucine-rich repeat (LRR) protein
MAIYPGQKVGLIDVNLKSELSSLSSIVIKNNYLSSIIVPVLDSLKTIDLSNNPFTITGVTFGFNPTVTGLTISGCGVNFNTNFLLNTPNLVELDLSDNALTIVDVNHLNYLHILNLSINQLTEFNLYDKTNVLELHLNNNLLSSVNLSGLTGEFLLSGQIFNLNNNQLTSINFNGLNYVETLNLNNNLLTNVSLMGMNNLSYLNLSHNQLTGITIEYSSSLFTLNLSGNSISDIDFTEYVNMTSLNIGSNLLTNIILSSG